jgi:ABC-type glycerol-3-phosphate transport system substrate-binding protein
MFDGFGTWLNDPQRSLVPGLVGATRIPAGPKGSFSPYAGSGVGVARYSKNPEMAWLWAQWATAKGTYEAKILGQFHNFPTRTSVTKAPEVVSALQTSSLAIPRLVDEIWTTNSLTTLLGFPLWLQAAIIIATALNTAWIGTVSPKDALAQAQTKLEAMGKLTF